MVVMCVFVDSHTLTGQFDSICTCGNADCLVVVVGFEVVLAGAFVGGVF
jgi:hypothetical protein